MKRTLLLAATVAVLCAATTLAAPAAVTNATYHPFLVHVNANKAYPDNCGNAEWSSPQGGCSGTTAPSGHSYGFNQTAVDVAWCVPGAHLCTINGTHKTPHGYPNRWMRFCERQGFNDCRNWLLGAVHMPNGPFHVVDGVINGHRVHPDNGIAHEMTKDGGPLHLVVTYTGSIYNGAGKNSSNGYTFGVIGKVKF